MHTRPRALLLALLPAITPVAGPVRAAELPAEVQAAARFEELWRASGAPGLSFAVAVKGRMVVSRGVGYIDLDNLVAASGTTVYNIGSISKVHAAVAVMQLVEKGLVSLDDPIQKYVPSFPDKGAPVTIRHIMTHTSGIRHYGDKDFARSGNTGENILPLPYEESLAIFKDDPLLFEPGAFYSYSSYAVNMLQSVVEKATSRSFEDFLRENVWGPSGMMNTAFDVPARIVPGRARSYELANGPVRNTPYGDIQYKFAGGGMISTVEDLVRFGSALNAGRLLKPETTALMYKPAIPSSVKRFDANGPAAALDFEQALQWVRQKDPAGRVVMTHCGAVKNFRGCLANFIDEGVVVALLGNASTTPGGRDLIALAQVFLPRTAAEP